jgi:hypothetical protein
MRADRPFPRVRVVPLVLFSALASGCIRSAGGPSGDLSKPSAPAAVFPAPSELAPLPSLPPPEGAFESGDVPVDRWAVEGATQVPGDEQARYDDPSPWGDLVRAYSTAHAGTVRLSSSLRCAALETARFYVQLRGLPTESLRRFLVARCGATSPDPSVSAVGGNVGDAITDAALFEQAKAPVQGQLGSLASGTGPRLLGLAAYRAQGRFAVVIVSASDLVALQPMPRSIDDSRHVSIRGKLRVSGEEAIGNRSEPTHRPAAGLKLPIALRRGIFLVIVARDFIFQLAR